MKKRILRTIFLIVTIMVFVTGCSNAKTSDGETNNSTFDNVKNIVANNDAKFQKIGFGERYNEYFSDEYSTDVVLYQLNGDEGKTFILGERTEKDTGVAYKTFTIDSEELYRLMSISKNSIFFARGMNTVAIDFEKISHDNTYLEDEDFQNKWRIEKRYDLEKKVVKNPYREGD